MQQQTIQHVLLQWDMLLKFARFDQHPTNVAYTTIYYTYTLMVV